MRRLLALLLGIAALTAALLYQFAGLRVALDGSGMWPRFVSTGPDYDALEADRERQRAPLAEPAANETSSVSAPPAAPTVAPTAAGSPSIPPGPPGPAANQSRRR